MTSTKISALVYAEHALRRIVLIGSAAALLAVSLSTMSVEARIKGKDMNGCTQKDYDSPLGKKCTSKEIANLLQGTTNRMLSYTLICGAGGNKCCKVTEMNNIVPGSCSSALTAIPPSDRPSTKGGVLDPGPKQRPRRDAISTGGGILEPGPGGFGPQGPASTGAPLSTGRGSAPPPKIN
jgi:hypothetical protein